MELKILLSLLILTLPLVSCLHSETCYEDADCDIDFVCQEGHCICDHDFQYDDKRGECVKLSGAICEIDDYIFECVDNAFCDDSTKSCTCMKGFTPTASKECKRSYGETCSEADLCNYSNFLICDKVSNNCSCTNKEGMTYDPVRKSCVSKLGHECEFYDWMGFRMECVPNAVCAKLESDFTGICQCDNGFSNTSLEFCGKMYGQSCLAHSDCFTRFCNQSCLCPSKSVYDSSLDICRIKAGQHCVIGQLCVHNATCNLISRQCQCDSSEFFNVGGLCTQSKPNSEQTSDVSDQGNQNFQFSLILLIILISVDIFHYFH